VPSHASYTAGVKKRSLTTGRLAQLRVVVDGSGDVGSAVAHRLFGAGAAVVIVDHAQPTVTRRGMAFADALFDGSACLDGIEARRVDDLTDLPNLLDDHTTIPVQVGDLTDLVGSLRPDVLVDARLRKRERPQARRRMAPLTIGLGPGFVAGLTVDVAIETSWEALGAVIWRGSTRALAGEPRPLGGHGRDRYVYASAGGIFHTPHQIGDAVEAGNAVASIEDLSLMAPLAGRLRGLCRDGVPVAIGTKVIEIDPRGDAAIVTGIGERPRKIADGVLIARQAWNDRPHRGR